MTDMNYGLGPEVIARFERIERAIAELVQMLAGRSSSYGDVVVMLAQEKSALSAILSELADHD